MDNKVDIDNVAIKYIVNLVCVTTLKYPPFCMSIIDLTHLKLCLPLTRKLLKDY